MKTNSSKYKNIGEPINGDEMSKPHLNKKTNILKQKKTKL